ALARRQRAPDEIDRRLADAAAEIKQFDAAVPGMGDELAADAEPAREGGGVVDVEAAQRLALVEPGRQADEGGRDGDAEGAAGEDLVEAVAAGVGDEVLFGEHGLQGGAVAGGGAGADPLGEVAAPDDLVRHARRGFGGGTDGLMDHAVVLADVAEL